LYVVDCFWCHCTFWKFVIICYSLDLVVFEHLTYVLFILFGHRRNFVTQLFL